MKEILLAGYSKNESRFFTQRLTEEGKFNYCEITSERWGNEYQVVFPISSGDSNFVVIHRKGGKIYVHEIYSSGVLEKEEVCSEDFGGYCSNLFSFERNGSIYLVGQTEGKKFIIKKVDFKEGKLITLYEDQWANFYGVIGVIPLGHKLLLYIHSEGSNKFATYFINDEFELSSSIYNKKWGNYYKTIRYFKQGDNTYIYGFSKHNILSDDKVFIQLVKNDGDLGDTSDTMYGSFDQINHFEINGDCFLYGQKSALGSGNTFFVRPIIENGSLGKESYNEEWVHYYGTQGTLQIAGKTFFYGNTTEKAKSGKKIFVLYPVTPDGRLGKRIIVDDKTGDEWTHFYDFLFPIHRENFDFSQTWIGDTFSGNEMLKDICIPGSHDAGMYKLSNVTILGRMFPEMLIPKDMVNIVNNMALTQGKNILEQLNSGARYFDLRPKYIGNEFYIYHGGLALGPKFREVLKQVKFFLEHCNTEFVLLGLTHFDLISDWDNYKEINKGQTDDVLIQLRKDLIKMRIDLLYKEIEKELGDLLLEKSQVEKYFDAQSDEKNAISNLPISQLQGKVILLIEEDLVRAKDILAKGSFSKAWDERNNSSISLKLLDNYNFYTFNPNSSAQKELIENYPLCFGDESSKDSKSINLFIEDDYANREKYEDMKSDQLHKFESFGSNKSWRSKTSSYKFYNYKGEEYMPQQASLNINKDSLFSLDWTLTLGTDGIDKADLDKKLSKIKELSFSLSSLLKSGKVLGETFAEFIKDPKYQKFLIWSNKVNAKKVNHKLIKSDKISDALIRKNDQNRKVNILSVDYLPHGIVDLCREISKK